VAKGIYIIHVIFVDDVILFGNENFVEWEIFKEIYELFCKATGMIFSSQKSLFL
jgi:hypothetical protein